MPAESTSGAGPRVPVWEVELLLGAEERITVARELVRRDVDKRLLRDQRRGQHIVYSLNTSVMEEVAALMLDLVGKPASRRRKKT